MKEKLMSIGKDILKEGGKWSQGRIYLLSSVVAYYITLGLMTGFSLSKTNIQIENFRMIVDALEYAMTLFGGYVFGGKFIDMFRTIRTPKESGGKKILNEETAI